MVLVLVRSTVLTQHWNPFLLFTEEVLQERVNCTACGQQVNHFQRNSVYEHPMLKVLICKVGLTHVWAAGSLREVSVWKHAAYAWFVWQWLVTGTVLFSVVACLYHLFTNDPFLLFPLVML